MPETRYIMGYKDDKLIAEEPYEVSNEELAREADEKLLRDLLNIADKDILIPQMGKALKALIKSRR